jgi:hypothetical protein
MKKTKLHKWTFTARFRRNAFGYIPVPPLNEQKRIVAKVDELMKFCDALEVRLSQSQTVNEFQTDD